MTTGCGDAGSHILEQSAPAFLRRLDTDPDQAWAEFHSFAWRLLRSYPPPVFRECSMEDRDDIIAGIVRDCRMDGFRMLRSYVDRGFPFAGWLGRVARNRALDLKRQEGRVGPCPEWLPVPGVSDPEADAHHRQLLHAVRDCLQQIGQRCRLLLEAAADESKPAEIALLLRRPGEGKQISDSLRECRRQLRDLLRQRGFELALREARESNA